MVTITTITTTRSGKIPKIVAYGAFDETVCTAPLGPKAKSFTTPPEEMIQICAQFLQATSDAGERRLILSEPAL